MTVQIAINQHDPSVVDLLERYGRKGELNCWASVHRDWVIDAANGTELDAKFNDLLMPGHIVDVMLVTDEEWHMLAQDLESARERIEELEERIDSYQRQIASLER